MWNKVVACLYGLLDRIKTIFAMWADPEDLYGE
jgi:hypothetical protein